VRLGSRVSLELEGVATFTNFLKVEDDTGDPATDTDWRVRTSNVGWRVGAGVSFWF